MEFFQGINRILLKWMKLWDEFVFGKSKKSLKKSKPETIKQSEKQNKYGKRKQNWDYEEEMVRPMMTLLLTY